VAVVLILTIFATRLTFSVLYFCELHSVRHLLSSNRTLQISSTRSALRVSAPYAVAAGILIIGFALSGKTSPMDFRRLESLFVGLAALTVPRMILGHKSGVTSSRG